MNNLMRTAVFAGQKGGITKSATASHLAFYAALKKKRVLVVDLDGQANTTRNLLGEVPDGAVRTAQLFYRDELVGELVKNDRGITVICGDEALNEIAEDPEADELAPAQWLAERFASQFDLCIIDTPPTLDKRLRAGLAAADFVVMPFIPVRESVDGLNDLLNTINKVREKWNPRLQYLGFLANKVNPRSKSHSALQEEVGRFAGDLLLPFKIHDRTAVADMLALSRPVWEGKAGESHRKAGDEFYSACKEIMKRIFK